jgi:GDP-mannose pyrophosphatase NudK
MATIQILKRETLSNKKYPLQNVLFEKPGANGEFHTIEKEVYFRPNAVAVLLVDADKKKILLNKQFRLPAFLNGSLKGFLVETCAGIMDDGETEEQTAYREAEEETGYQITNLNKIGGVYTSVGGITEFLHLFTANYNSEDSHSKSGGLKEAGEDIELLEIGFADAREKLNQGWFIDAKTVLLLQHFFLNQEIK